MTRPDLHSLLERVRSAEKGSMELDWLVAEALGEIPDHTIRPVGWDYDWYRSSETEWTLWRAKDAEGRSVEYWQPAQRSTSLDAVVSLIEKELPGWPRSSGTCGENNLPWACLTEPEEPCRDFTGRAPDEVLALLEALITAKLSMENTDAEA